VKTITCKLPESLDAQLEAAAREEGVSKSQVLRNALEERVGRSRAKRSPRAFDLVKDLCGSIKGPADLLTNPRYMENFGA
jgi:hypothetical protein